MDDNRDLVRSQFGRSAADYAKSDIHARGDAPAMLVELLHPQPTWHVLDVATGAGHTALALAPHVADVVATDITPQMLEQTRRLAAERGLANVTTQIADAEALPFEDGRFDLVTCRLAFHHFPHPEQSMREFARVLKPGGQLGFSDNVAVEDPAGASAYNAYEKLRDPSHHEVPPLSRLVTMMETVGLHVEATRSFSKETKFDDWTDRMRVSAPDKQRLLEMLRTLPATARPLLAPRVADGVQYFSLWECVVVARRHTAA